MDRKTVLRISPRAPSWSFLHLFLFGFLRLTKLTSAFCLLPFQMLDFSTSEIFECASSPCQFGGSCEDLINGYKCHCTLPYEGVHCERRKYLSAISSTTQQSSYTSGRAGEIPSCTENQVFFFFSENTAIWSATHFCYKFHKWQIQKVSGFPCSKYCLRRNFHFRNKFHRLVKLKTVHTWPFVIPLSLPQQNGKWPEVYLPEVKRGDSSVAYTSQKQQSV